MFDIVERIRRFNSPNATRFHKDCAECCAAGRCHWCLVRIGPGSIIGTKRTHKGLTYRICAIHVQRFQVDPASPFGGTRQAEFTVVPVTLR